jgi:Fungal Zn(2)-Cys(6) binuclear cluster domain
MGHTSDHEAGHILTHLSSGSSYPSAQHQHQQLTPSSSAPGISPPSTQPLQLGSPQPPAIQNGVKRSRQRPTKSCEECRRKKLKCDRELPCSNCKRGGRDGSICHFKDAVGFDGGSAPKKARPDDLERERRPYSGAPDHSYGRERGEDVDRGGRYYPNVPHLARVDSIGPGRGILAYGMNDFHVDAIQARGVGQKEDQRTALTGESVSRYPNVPALAKENNMSFGRGMFVYGMNDASAEVTQERRHDLLTPVSSAGLGHDASVRALGRVHVKGSRSRYVGIGDRMAILDHVSISSC